MGYRLGVDLGTTFSAAAVARGGVAEAISLGDHGHEIPSIALKSADGSLLFGVQALADAEDQPDRVAREFKRRIGDKTSFYLGGTPMSPHLLSGKLLGWVVAQVARGQGSGPDEVVVTCPANWGPFRRELMDQVVSISGLPAARICTEPEAAALHFASTGQVREGDAIAVYDLGGGTFDAAVLRLERQGFSFLGRPEGIEQLGGLDFDDAVFGHFRRSLQLPEDLSDDPELMHGLLRLRRECLEAKEKLSHQTAVTIHVGLPGVRPSVRMTRAELEDLIGPSIEQTVDCLERAVEHANLSVADLAAVVLVGGSARIPLVSEQVARRLGRPVTISPHPKLCVAMGAALLPTLSPVPTSAPSPASAGAPAPTAGAHAPAGGGLAPGAPAPTAGALAPDVAALAPGAGGPGPAAGGPGPGAPASAAGGLAPGEPAHVAPGAAGLAPTGNSDSQPLVPADTGRDAGPPASGARRRRAASAGARRPARYALAATILFVGGVVFALIGPTSAVSKELSWDVDSARTTALPAGTAAGAQLTPTLLGVDLPGDPMKLDRATRTFEIGGYKLFLAGPVVGVVEPPGGKVLLTRSGGAWWSPFATIPGGALILGVLFSIAYAEALLRELRLQRGTVRLGQLAGMIGVGLVAGLVAAVATWLGGRLLAPVSAVLTVVSIAGSAGLLAFAVGSGRRRTARSLPER
ncbi:Hsp70 family protein [Kribbella qitaiheensis]|uniref:Hsp70 family protein n=1 Tax=Kribbella qitaiheensis TaxID=1544730 RepID=A0A7G6X5N1_9ACTN|nr:Hsp70 family protein [Kribbella qitaiheensis]QNE21546.1 Hsp70 family protein [Kribbella qitaiheensis]